MSVGHARGSGLLATAQQTSSVSDASDDDSAIVVRAQRDPAAFSELYCRYADPVYRYCHRRLGDSEAARDAASRVFAQALAALARCQPRSFRSWLFAIAHHVIVDDFRARARATGPLSAALNIPDEAANPESRLLAAETAASVHELLRRLPEDQRQVIELRLAGLSGAEIAHVVGRSLAAVKSSQFRGYGRLRALLGDDDADGRTP